MESLYAPPDHPVFTLVPTTFHERVTQLYMSIGQPVVTVKTFWDIYCNLLGMLREPADDQMTDVLDTFQANINNSAQDMALLPNIEPFRLGKPLDLGGKSTYIGGLEDSETLPLGFNRVGAEYARFTSDEDDDSSDSDSEPEE
jgi:hypothetical protein